MYLNPLDKHSAEHLAKRSNFNLFSLIDDVSRVGLIQNLIVDNLINAKTSLVLVPNTDDAHFIQSCLSHVKLDHLSLLVADNKTISEMDLAKLRSAIKNNNAPKSVNEYEILRANASKSITNLRESYDQLNKKIFGERSWRVLSAHKEHFHYHNEVNLVKRKINVDEITFTQKEYWNIRGRIQDASNSYCNKFDFLERVDCLSPLIYQEDHIDSKVVQLEKLINKGSSLLLAFGSLIEGINAQYKQEGLDEFEQLSAMSAAIEHSLSEYRSRNANKETKKGLQGKLKSVFSQKSGKAGLEQLRQQVKFLCTEFKESKFFDLNIEKPDFDVLNDHSIKEILDQTNAVLSNWQHYLSSYSNSKLKQLSPLNSENGELRNLDEKLKSYLAEVNNAELLNQSVEDNTLSMYKKIDLLESTLDKLRTGFAILTENEDYIEWRIMLAFCKKETSELIEAFKDHPVKVWTGIFDQLFIGHLLDKNESPRLPKNESQLQHIDELTMQSRTVTVDTILNKYQQQKSIKLDELKKENKNLYTTIVKKKDVLDLSWPKLISQAPDTISAVFPVIIVCQQAVKSIKPLYYKWSECISYKWTSFEDTGSMKIKSFSLKQTVLEIDEISDQVGQLKSYFNSNHIEGIDLIGDQVGKVNGPLAKMDNIAKLRVAKAMSRNILGINPRVRLFYLKNNCIISCLADKENIRIVDLFDKHGIKEVGKIYQLDETIIDMLVDTSKQTYILTQDGLLNTSDVELFDWQYHNLKTFKQLGCQVVNMWTANIELGYQSLVGRISNQNPTQTELFETEAAQEKLINA